MSYLVSNELANSLKIAESASDEFGAPLFDLSTFNLDLIPKDLVDVKLVGKLHALPLYKRGNRLFIAVSDPTNLKAIDEIKFHTGLSTDAVLVEEQQLSHAIHEYVEKNEEPLGAEFGDLDEGLEDLDIEAVDEDGGGDEDTADIDNTPIVRFVNKVLIDVFKLLLYLTLGRFRR